MSIQGLHSIEMDNIPNLDVKKSQLLFTGVLHTQVDCMSKCMCIPACMHRQYNYTQLYGNSTHNAGGVPGTRDNFVVVKLQALHAALLNREMTLVLYVRCTV